jgi:hypothetical protein
MQLTFSSFSHDSVLQDDSPANVIMLDVRKRKGLKPQPNQITGASLMQILVVFLSVLMQWL